MKSTAYYRFELVSILRQSTILFYPLITTYNRIQGSSWPPFLKKDTEFVIEGYFRSGNTFAIRAFTTSQPEQVKLTCHTHAKATVLLATKRNLPILILLRNPADTVVSATLKAPGTTLSQHLRWYIRYYEKVYQLRDHVYIALFDEVIQDFGQVIQNTNRRFNTNFAPFKHTTANVKEVFAWIEAVDRSLYHEDISRYSLPLQRREKYKEDIKEKLFNENRKLLQKAEALYEKILKNRWEIEEGQSGNH